MCKLDINISSRNKRHNACGNAFNTMWHTINISRKCHEVKTLFVLSANLVMSSANCLAYNSHLLLWNEWITFHCCYDTSLVFSSQGIQRVVNCVIIRQCVCPSLWKDYYTQFHGVRLGCVFLVSGMGMWYSVIYPSRSCKTLPGVFSFLLDLSDENSKMPCRVCSISKSQNEVQWNCARM